MEKYIQLDTFSDRGKGIVSNNLTFRVPRAWLWQVIRDMGYKTIDEFLSGYMYDESYHVYTEALRDGVIVEEGM